MIRRRVSRRWVLVGATVVVLIAAAIAFLRANPDDVGALLTRFAWLGAIASMALWIVAAKRIWTFEGSRHHLVARILSVITMVLLDVAVIIFFWPGDYIHPLVTLDAFQARSLVAFIVGTQVMAALYQLTAPPQGRTQRGADGRRLA